VRNIFHSALKLINAAYPNEEIFNFQLSLKVIKRSLKRSSKECLTKSTNDITAYKQTNLYRMFTNGMLPSKYHVVLDEAYGGIGGDLHLTPFTRSQLLKARLEYKTKYGKMKSFKMRKEH